MSLSILAANRQTGEVTIGGADSRRPTTPFTFEWGDSFVSQGFFPQGHVYLDTKRNYVVKVTAHYPGGESDFSQALVRFAPSNISPKPLPPEVAVVIPNEDLKLATRLYPVPAGLTFFDDGYFEQVSRSSLEYVLSLAASIQIDFANDDVFRPDGQLRQVLLRHPGFQGMYSLWFTNPIAFAAGDYSLRGSIQYSSFFHEMGHNITLNSSSAYYYGGKIDGAANAIYSETMAQIFQHATAYELINNSSAFGLPDDLILEIKQSALSAVDVVRQAYERYTSTGKKFSSWNDAATSEDETFDTFMTIAYKFLWHAESSGRGYRQPVKRMMKLLQGFNSDWAQRYAQNSNTAEAASFRATLMIAALSFAFSTDLRSEFRELGFPINDQTYSELITAAEQKR